LAVGTSWSGYELVLGTSWLGYELAWYDLASVRVDWKPQGKGAGREKGEGREEGEGE